MKSIQIQLTTKCNQTCFMCRKYTWKSKEIDVSIIKKYLEKYPNATFTFSGGDPLSYSKLRELTRLLKEKNIIYQVFTNLNYELTDVQFDFLKNADVIQVSFDGSNEATYNAVRRPRQNGYGTIIVNIYKFWTLKKDKLKLNATISNRNYYDVRNIWKFCKARDYNIRFFPVHTDDAAKLEPYMIKHIRDSFYGDIPDCAELLVHKRPEYNGKCFVKSEHLVIDEDGRCYPCCRAINDNGEDWNGEFSIVNLADLNDESVLYPFCKECDRYRKFNENWELYKDKDKVYL